MPHRVLPVCLAALLAGSIFAPAPAVADDITTVASCPGQATLPVTFKIDCTNIKDPARKQLCVPFIQNQACKVFPVYRKITGIKLEVLCPSITYTIYDLDTWPPGAAEAGGLAGNCEIKYLGQYSIDMKSSIGPYDVHELLHEYQMALGALPAPHILFGSSMAEVARDIGDQQGFEAAVVRLKEEVKRLDADFANGTLKQVDTCPIAETAEEETLYLQNTNNVALFYSKLVRSKVAAQADRETRFNQMFDAVSGGTAKATLIARGCAPF